jgi:Tfp pilus assembly protein PilF
VTNRLRVAILPFTACLIALPAHGVPDEVCAKCHAEIYRSYEATPMAQSSGRVDAAHAPTATAVPFSTLGAAFQVLPQTSGPEIRITEDGQSASHRLRYFIGAGVTGRSYIWESNRYLFQSPASWYSSIRQWGLSPGYENATRVNLIRPIEASCLNCHSSGVGIVTGARNQYEDPPFDHGGVSCERCHGNAEQHLARVAGKAHKGGAAIVNPARLDPPRRDSICAQCHLMGIVRVARRSAQPYAPGAALFDSTSVFLWSEGERPLPANSHFEQLIRSACWRQTQGKLWCGSCHDPHRAVPPAEQAAWYRQRCETCHGRSAPICSAPLPERRRASDNCISCHMPSREAATIQHAAQTDHAIPRRPKAPTELSGVPADAELTPFPGSTAATRELGLAYAEQALSRNNRQFGLRALTLLDPVFAADHSDASVGDQLAQLLDKAGKPDRACTIFLEISGLKDVSPAALVNAGTCLANTGRASDAIALWKRALEKNSGEESARLNLAVALFRSSDATSARATLQPGLALDPFWSRARELLAAMQ